MRLDPDRPQAEIIVELARLTELAWGPPADPIRNRLVENAGKALWRIAQAPLEAFEMEPDFVSHDQEQSP